MIFSKYPLIQPNNYKAVESQILNVMIQIMNIPKYMIVKTCPVKMNGGSTGRVPIHVNRITTLNMIHSVNWLIG